MPYPKHEENMDQESRKDDEIEIEIDGQPAGEQGSEAGSEESSGSSAETDATGEGEESAEQKTADYEEKLKEWEDRYLRLAAEFENYKKRTVRQFQDMAAGAREEVITGLLEVIDNFERALEASTKSSDFKALQTGMQMIYNNFIDFLKKNGVEPIEAVSREFDPNVHEAVMQVASEEYPEGIIVSELTRGYKLKDKVIRFSKVAVSKGQSDGEGDDESS